MDSPEKPKIIPYIQTIPIRQATYGHIKIGGLGDERKNKTSPGTHRLPVRYNEFVITQNERDGSANFVENVAMRDALSEYFDGDGLLKRIPILLLDDDPTKVFKSAFERFDGKKKVCYGDGINAMCRRGDAWFPTECSCGKQEKGHTPINERCKISFDLICDIDVPSGPGAYLFHTTSFYSFVEITACLIDIYRKTDGLYTGLPFFLVLKSRVSEEGKPFQYVSIEPRQRPSQMIEAARSILDGRLVRAKDTKALKNNENLLTAGVFSYDEALIAQEYNPDYEDPEIDMGTDPAREQPAQAVNLTDVHQVEEPQEPAAGDTVTVPEQEPEQEPVKPEPKRRARATAPASEPVPAPAPELPLDDDDVDVF